ncbi:MAG: thioesterase [Epsilonproteobacteria bacterium]|nr:MAG: thioesterase [Campylobacterota bacterium]RLA65766.1 MAG: thioesterase [Campylobacterota bacterium]
MARIKLSLPEKPVFSQKLKVRVDDINYGGHMGNDAILKFCHEIRLNYLESLGQSELNCFGKSIIMSDAAIQYKSEAFRGEEIEVKISLDDFNPYGLDFLYQFLKTSGEEIARAKTGIVFFDYQNKKIAKAPKNLKELLV